MYKIGLLLFGSGLCALIYQVAWLREMRLVFGASTAASAAVLAIFMGGLGLGGAILGRRADRHPCPLLLYAHLELAIAGAAAVSPFLLQGLRYVYIWLGGSPVLGLTSATLVRLVLSALVLGLPTFLMGGTMPAAVRSVETVADVGRRHLGWLYGLNTLGAVTGAVTATFVLLEVFGTRNSLWLACLVNVLIGLSARVLSRTPAFSTAPVSEPVSAETLTPRPSQSPFFVYLAAGLVGLAFFLMEIVWYRMLGPILGGSTYTFGLILAVALLGIGTGACLYALRPREHGSTLIELAWTCGLEALFLVIPYALGDRLAVLAALLHPVGGLGLGGQTLGWTLITGMVVWPAAIVAGYQFPLLIGLLGQSGRDVGRQTGQTYAWNTVGAIVGSLAGGFVLLPLFSATGTWLTVVALLAGLGLVTTVLSIWKEGRRGWQVVPVVVLVAAVVLTTADGPTSAWRHSPIGAGRTNLAGLDRNGLHQWANQARRAIAWETDGLESSVGLDSINGLAFVLNGKSDGNAWRDAATQVMSGLVGAVGHPAPRQAAVIGLGTGSSAGWLAQVPGMNRVDVFELEPAILEVARRCAPVNHQVLAHPNVRTIIADAREALLTSREKYDVIFSEPSNPYRIGIASLFTREFYQAVAGSLTRDGVFVQWVQAYEVDTETVLTIFATLAEVFPAIEIWQNDPKDMLLVCRTRPHDWSVPELQARLSAEPYRSAAVWAWGATDPESFLAHYIAQPSFIRELMPAARNLVGLNTDDLMLVEFGFARTVGRNKAFDLRDLRQVARIRNEHRAPLRQGAINWDRVDDVAVQSGLARSPEPGQPGYRPDRAQRAAAVTLFKKGDMAEARAAWKAQPEVPYYPQELALVAESLAEISDETSVLYVEKLRPYWPIEAQAILGRYYWRCGQGPAAVTSLEQAFVQLRTQPCAVTPVMERALGLAGQMAVQSPDQAPRLYRALADPFCVSILNEQRLNHLLMIAVKIGHAATAAVIKQYEPHVPWTGEFLNLRRQCYRATGDALAGRAESDLRDFLAESLFPFSPELYNLVANPPSRP